MSIIYEFEEISPEEREIGTLFNYKDVVLKTVKDRLSGDCVECYFNSLNFDGCLCPRDTFGGNTGCDRGFIFVEYDKLNNTGENKMQQIIRDIENKQPLIEIGSIKFPLEHQEIVVYETAAGSGLGVLVVDEETGRSGFRYHKDLVTQGNQYLKFSSDNPKQAIINVLNAGRKVLILKNFEEFLDYSVKHSKL